MVRYGTRLPSVEKVRMFYAISDNRYILWPSNGRTSKMNVQRLADNSSCDTPSASA